MITSIHIENLWQKHTIHWNHLDPKVNILVGINGSGKSTILNIIEETLSHKNVTAKKVKAKIDIKYSSTLFKSIPPNSVKINTFDTKSKGTKSNLDLQLEHLTFKKETSNSMTFLDYRLNMLDKSTSEIEKYKNQIDAFFSLINQFFVKTNKKIIFDKINNSIKFKVDEIETIELTDLSSGEKQLLVLLFTIFLQDNQPYVVLLDEPEISLHLDWQDILIQTLTTLNPNAQFIIVTHAPSVFGQGWVDKLVWIEDTYPKNNNLF